jgi:hypothetical protein
LDFVDYFHRAFDRPFRWTYTGRPVIAYPRKFQKKTLAFFVLTAFLGLVLMGCFGWFGLIPALGIAAWGMNFHKLVRVKCNNCGWSQKYLVRNRG